MYAGSNRLINIASGYAADIFYGDVVKLANTGTLQVETGTTTVSAQGVVGIFLGCTFTNPVTKQKQFNQYWPSGTVASDAYAKPFDCLS